MQDISFVAGYLAAKVSKTGAVGTVASFNFSNITWQAEGFRLGARYADPKMFCNRSLRRGPPSVRS